MKRNYTEFESWLEHMAAECESKRAKPLFPYDDGTGNVNLCSLSYSMMAARSGVSATTVSNFLQGKTKPQARTLWSICQGCGIDVGIVGKIQVQRATATKAQLLKVRKVRIVKHRKSG